MKIIKGLNSAIVLLILTGLVLVFLNIVNNKEQLMTSTLNVYGEPIELCCSKPLTGFYRDGKCITGPDDYGTHIVCAQVTDAFLEYSKLQGNDLITCRPHYNFPGLRDGDCWCLCISRWLEAKKNNVAPPINLKATHQKALEFVDLETLEKFSI